MTTSIRKTAMLIALLAIVAFAGLRLVGDSASAANTLRVTMPDAGQLEVGGSVRAAGALVGTVKDMKLDGRVVDLTLDLQDGVLPLHQDAKITMRPANLLGEYFLDLDAGTDSAPYMTNNDLPAEQTEVATSVQDVFDTLDAPRGAQLAAILTTLGEGLDGNGDNARELLAAMAPALEEADEVAKILKQQNATLSHLVETTDPVAAALADGGGKTLDSLVSAAEQLLAGVRRQQAALAATIEQLPSTLASARRTLTRFSGTATAATATLREIRPLTGDLSAVVDELETFADSADPALASLKPVLAEADKLLKQAAPVVAQLRAAGPDLTTTAKSLQPISRELLDKNLHGVMEFVRKWALSTNDHDSLSHYFRGVVYLTPESLKSIAGSLVPPALTGQTKPGTTKTTTPGLGEVLGPLGNLGNLGPTLNNLTSPLLGTVGGLLGASPRTSTNAAPDDSASGALGLTSQQERFLVQQLLGGGQ